MRKYSIYTVQIGDKIYVGATVNYQQRMQTHRANLERMIKNKKLDARSTTFKLVDISELLKHGYIFSLVTECKTESEAAQTEQELINKYQSLGISLNVATNTTYSYRKPKRKRSKYKSPDQIEYCSKLLSTKFIRYLPPPKNPPLSLANTP